MQITYSDKNAIFNHLANRKKWKNIADVDAILSRRTTRYNENDSSAVDVAADYFQAIHFDENFMDGLHVTFGDFASALKLIVAVDLDIEPDIPRYNEISIHKLKALFESRETEFTHAYDALPAEYLVSYMEPMMDGDSHGLQKIWYDTTQFTGYWVGFPSAFRVQRMNDGLMLRMSSDGRDAILSQTSILKAAQEQNEAVSALMGYAVREQLLLHLLENGTSAYDQDGREWSLVVVEGRHSDALIKLACLWAQEKLHLGGNHFSAISFDEGVGYVAIERKAFENAKRNSMYPDVSAPQAAYPS